MIADAGVVTRWIWAVSIGGLLAFLIAGNLREIVPAWFGEPGAVAALGPELLLYYSYLPRLIVAVLAGAALGLSGVLLQQVLQNPLAAGETLGVTSGAHLALTIGLLAMPAIQARYPELFAICGAFAAWGLIAAIAWRRRAEPMTLILTGFIVNFVLGSIAMLLMLLHQEYLSSLFIWGAGSLAQGGWEDVVFLAVRIVLAGAVAAMMVKPLLILGFGDQSAQSLGISLRYARPVLLATGIFLAATVVAAVGVISFVGLAAPHIARLAGAQRLGQRLIAAPIAGALLVLVVDQSIQYAFVDDAGLMPTGAVTALLGAPLMVWLLGRIPAIGLEGIGRGASALPGLAPPPNPTQNTGVVVTWVVLALVAALAVGMFVGRDPSGFTFGFDAGTGVFDWRVPRVMAAATAGLALGLSGCLVQRLFANAMASPEILGIGGGVAAGLIAALMISPAAGYGMQLAGAVCGAIVVTALVLVLAGRRDFSPVRLLLVGIAVTALLDAAVLVFLTLGDPRAGQVLAWLGGSTYRATMGFAWTVGLIGIAGLAVALPLARWLDILPLGQDVARGLGVPAQAVRMLVLVIAAVTTAAAALVIGPMSFVGLLAPHSAALAGLRRAGPQMVGSALIGAALVTFADWMGRVVFAPTELPAGILAVLIGAIVVTLFLVARRSAVPG